MLDEPLNNRVGQLRLLEVNVFSHCPDTNCHG
jgi:hypothetical protein